MLLSLMLRERFRALACLAAVGLTLEIVLVRGTAERILRTAVERCHTCLRRIFLLDWSVLPNMVKKHLYLLKLEKYKQV